MYNIKGIHVQICSRTVRDLFKTTDLLQKVKCERSFSQCDKGKKEKEEKKSCKSVEKQGCENNKNGGEDVPRIGINGFGRIGRMVVRVATEHSCPLKIVAINDPIMKTDLMAHMLKYDTTHGRFVGNVAVNNSKLNIDGNDICVYNEKEPKTIPWSDLKVDYVIEASGHFKTMQEAEGHIKSGAKKVLITSSSEDAPTYVLGANLDCYDPKCNVVACGSCVTNALAPLVKVIHDHFQIEEAMVTAVHAVTMSQSLLDSPKCEEWRKGRAAFQNIVPVSSRATRDINQILPDLKDKLTATSIRVPVPNVSLLDLTCRLCKCGRMEDINKVLCEAKEESLLGILDVTSEPVVSSDFLGSPYSCTVDCTASTALSDKFVKLLAWYDNEYGYTCRVIDLIKFIHAEQLSNKSC